MLLPLFHPHPSFPPKQLTTPTLQTPKPSTKKILCSSKTHQTLPKSAIQRIAEKLRTLGYTEEKENPTKPRKELNHIGEIFIPLPENLPKQRVGYTIDTSWSTPENPVPEPGSGRSITEFHELNDKVEREKTVERKERKERGYEKVPSLAELKLSKEELRRLREIGIRIRKKLKVGKAGITEGIVNGIHERWRRTEVVKIACEDLCKLNMKRTHELLERKTGGLVVWRSGSNIILYRGADYKYPYFLVDEVATNDSSHEALSNSNMDDEESSGNASPPSSITVGKSAGQNMSNKMAELALINGVGVQNRVRFQLPGEAQLVEEADSLLDGLGPQFTDWWDYEPLPIDADLLPAIVPGYRRPFRLLPFGVKPKLTNDEMTILRRLGRPLPCHFALGRNRNLQGLAASIVKLWEKCEIAKIAVKRGVQNTNSEIMAEEIKRLTGGTLLARDKEFIVFYRGKDFLPQAVSSAIAERRKYSLHRNKHETNHIASVATTEDPKLGSSKCDSEENIVELVSQKRNLLAEHRKIRSEEAAVQKTGIKLSLALKKKARAEKLLEELEKAEISQQPEIDKEGITEEERYMLRKVGLRMKPFLLLGRRGVFDGTVENMHLHWKYRELVKIISKESSIDDVYPTARTLEAESGGILVAVERVSKGYAIIVYRGKNYERPATLRPKTLLTKREAMKRSLEAQRRESLKLHVLKLSKNIDELKLQLANGKESESLQPADDESKRQLVSEKLESVSIATVSVNSALADSSQNIHEDEIIDLFPKPEGENDDSEPALSGSILRESGVDNEDRFVDFASGPDNSLASCSAIDNADPESSDNDKVESPVISVENKIELSIPTKVGNVTNRMLSTAAPLSNKERLLLRRQALRMRKRPVLAVGRSNIVTGVAKTIKTHFEKHPLAIVNVKGRAKGTSVQELVFKLEQATGGILVSQEPNKVILYRGWGAGEDSGYASARNRRRPRQNFEGKEDGSQIVVSPELIAAIKLECGLQSNQQS